MSSNCVIWQGPDIKCINVCRGDSVSEVVYKLGKEIVELEKALDLSDLDLKCLVQQCVQCPQPDKSLQAVLTLIIEELCALNGVDSSNTPGTAELVPVAPCFEFVDADGDTIKNMSANAYLNKVGIGLCGAITSLATLTSTVQSQGQRITTLENYEHPEYTNPTIFQSCLFPNDPSTAVDIVEAFEELEKQFCNIRSITGMPTDLAQAVQKQCVGLNTSPAFSQNSPMSALPNWKPVVTSLSDSVNNLWITICDMRAGIIALASGIPTGCNLITMGFGVNISGSGSTLSAQIVFSGYATIPDTYVDCASGSILTITDAAGNKLTQKINIAAAKNNPSGIAISLANTMLNTASDYTFTIESCFTNGSNTCSKTTTKIVANGSVCPAITTVPVSDSVAFSFNDTATAGTTYKVDLLNSQGSVVISSQQFASGATLSGSFTGLTGNTNYNLRITINNGVAPFVCDLKSFNTTATNCVAPGNVSAYISAAAI